MKDSFLLKSHLLCIYCIPISFFTSQFLGPVLQMKVNGCVLVKYSEIVIGETSLQPQLRGRGFIRCSPLGKGSVLIASSIMDSMLQFRELVLKLNC